MQIIPDILWKEISGVIILKEKKVGRPSKDPRKMLEGILFVLRTGCPWNALPEKYGKPSTVHGTLMRWARNGIFEKILQISVEIAMECLGPIKCFLTDASSSKAPFANFGGKNPTDRAKQGIKKSLVIDYNRIILSVIVDAANVHDSKLLLPHAKMLCKFVSPKKAISMLADAAFDVEFLRRELVKHNIVLLASSNLRRSRNRTPYKSHGRWRIEQVFGILHWFRGIKTCWAKTKISFLAFCQFASAMHNFRCSGIFG